MLAADGVTFSLFVKMMRYASPSSLRFFAGLLIHYYHAPLSNAAEFAAPSSSAPLSSIRRFSAFIIQIFLQSRHSSSHCFTTLFSSRFSGSFWHAITNTIPTSSSYATAYRPAFEYAFFAYFRHYCSSRHTPSSLPLKALDFAALAYDITFIDYRHVEHYADIFFFFFHFDILHQPSISWWRHYFFFSLSPLIVADYAHLSLVATVLFFISHSVFLSFHSFDMSFCWCHDIRSMLSLLITPTTPPRRQISAAFMPHAFCFYFRLFHISFIFHDNACSMSPIVLCRRYIIILHITFTPTYHDALFSFFFRHTTPLRCHISTFFDRLFYFIHDDADCHHWWCHFLSLLTLLLITFRHFACPSLSHAFSTIAHWYSFIASSFQCFILSILIISNIEYSHYHHYHTPSIIPVIVIFAFIVTGFITTINNWSHHRVYRFIYH